MICGSFSIYSVEYKCTSVDIKVTTTNITDVKLSKQKHHWMFNVSTKNHEPIVILTILPEIINVQNKYNENKKQIKTKIVVKIETPTPKKRPNNIEVKKPKNGKNIISINIPFN